VAVVVADELAARLGGQVRDLTRMLGGASRETWAFTLDGRPLVLRCDPAGAPRAGAMRREAELLRAAANAGMPVPEVVDADDSSIVMQRLEGETIARRILRDERFAGARDGLVVQCANAIARLHAGVAVEDIADLPEDVDPIATLRAVLDRFGEPHPALELGLLRLEARRPLTTRRTVVHGDFRLGNWMVDSTGLVGVLDWELAHVGDPVEDLGWMCVQSWRFGGSQPVAGVGTREELLTAYAAAGGGEVSLDELLWWELLGTVRWGVICIQQAATHLSGAVRSVELAAIGRRVCEVERDVLELIEPDVLRARQHEPLTTASTPSHAPHDRPTADEIVEAAQEWIGGQQLEGRDHFLARVTTRALDVVRRELSLGPTLASRHGERLSALGVESDDELATQIRAGRDEPAVVQALCDAVIDKLRVADPRKLY